MNTTGPVIANGLQALPSKASAPASTDHGTEQEDFAETLVQALEPGTPRATQRALRPDPKPTRDQTAANADPATDMGHIQGAPVMIAILGADPKVGSPQPEATAPSAVPTNTLPLLVAGSAVTTKSEIVQMRLAGQRSVSPATGFNAQGSVQETPKTGPSPADSSADLPSASKVGDAQIGFALDGLQTPLPPEAVHPHEQQALKAALKQLETAKAVLNGSPTALSESDAQTPPATTQSSAAQGTVAISQNLGTMPRPEAAASITVQAEQTTSMVPNLVEGLGAVGTEIEPTNPLDVSLFSSDAPAARAPDLTPLPALGSLLVRKLETGGGQIAVRLDPPELGRLDITLGLDEDGAVTAHIRADRPEALELMQREAKGLEQSLRQAGFTVDTNALSFSLNQGNRGHGGDATATPERYRKPNTGRDAEAESRVQHLEIHLQSNRALDVRV